MAGSPPDEIKSKGNYSHLPCCVGSLSCGPLQFILKSLELFVEILQNLLQLLHLIPVGPADGPLMVTKDGDLLHHTGPKQTGGKVEE